MTGLGSKRSHGRLWRWVAAAIFVAAGWSSGRAHAQTEAAPAKLPASMAPVAAGTETEAKTDNNILLTGCSSCSGGLLGSGAPDGPDAGGCNGCGSGECADGCLPGRFKRCSCCEGDSAVTRALCGLYNCICCPDPCYEPRWIATANASFWADSVRPQTQTVIRWDDGQNYRRPDRNEFFWAKEGGIGPGKTKETRVDYNVLGMYTEAGIGMAGVFTYVPYVEVEPQVNNHAAGFGDITVGTKAVLLDCELLQVGTEFKTFIPAGNVTKGLGTGHVSLEPSLLATLKLGPVTYLQTQVSEWIPIAGSQDVAGSLLHFHLSLNHLLYRILPDVVLIGTLELNGYSFQAGHFTDPVTGTLVNSSDSTDLSYGPGLRLVICDKCDFGLGTAFNISSNSGPEQVYRFEFRWRF